MATLFHPTSEAHQNFSMIAREVREKDNIAIITRHGRPCFALLPAEEINDNIEHIVVNTRDINNQWSKHIKLAEEGKTIYIKFHDTISLQLIKIETDEINDIIFAYSKDLQVQHKDQLNEREIKKLKSARELLNERKKLRTQDNT